MSVSISGRLASMGDEKLQILANSIAAYKNVAGAAPQAFAELWQTAALDAPGESDVILFDIILKHRCQLFATED